MNRYFNPPDLAPPFGNYSQGVEITEAEKIVYVAGQVGVASDGTVPRDFERQAEQAFRNVQVSCVPPIWTSRTSCRCERIF